MAWTLSGCNDYDETDKTSGTWVTIHEVKGDTEGEALPATNKKETKFTFDECQQKYQYFKLNITGIKSGSTMQLGDFSLTYKACEHQWVKTETPIAPTCAEGGYDVEECSLCQETRNVANDKPALGHDFNENGLCSRCGASNTTPSKPSGEGTAESPYRISTAGELLWFAGLVNGTLDGVTRNTSAYAVLATDVNFGDINFVAIGTETYPFSGTFDGGSHTITINQSGSEDVALFGFLGNSTVKNLTVTGTINTTTKYAAGIAMQTKSGTTATVEKCISAVTIESSINGDGTHAGLVGVANGALNINNCAFTGAIKGSSTYACGGMIGWANSTVRIKNSYISATFNLDSRDCNTFSRNFAQNVTLDNCCYLNALGEVPASAKKLTSEQFSSGEAAYILQGEQEGTVWGQNIDNGQANQNYPVLGGAKVYGNKTCCGSESNPGGVVSIAYSNSKKEPVYSAAHNMQKIEAKAATCTEDGNIEYWICSYEEGVYYKDQNGDNKYDTVVIPATGHSFGEDGRCTVCSVSNTEVSQPEGDGTANNPYKIDTAGKLYWFAEQVNSGNTGISAVLMADITVNSGLEDKNGLLDSLTYDENTGEVTNGTSFKSWTPIGTNSNRYTGTFDGREHTISGLYFNNTATKYVGLFGYSQGTLKNVGVVDSYFNGGDSVGGVCGFSGYLSVGSIQNCYNAGAVSGASNTGGVCGKSDGSITNSYNTGAVSGASDTGGVSGSNSGTITSCYNIGSSKHGVCDYGTVTNCYYANENSSASSKGTKVSYEELCGESLPVGLDASIWETGAVITTTDTYKIYRMPSLKGVGIAQTVSVGQYDFGAGNETFIPISTPEELVALANDRTKWEENYRYVLAEDIDMTGKEISPIGNSSKWFKGKFSGNGHVVKNLTIDLIDSYHVGLFGDNAGLIMNVGIEGGSIKGQSFVGGLCGFNQGTISGCYNTAAVTGADMAIGGICGRTFGGTIKNCYNAGEISGNGYTRLLTVRRYVLLGVR